MGERPCGGGLGRREVPEVGDLRPQPYAQPTCDINSRPAGPDMADTSKVHFCFYFHYDWARALRRAIYIYFHIVLNRTKI
jgi:hypothetical protein